MKAATNMQDRLLLATSPFCCALEKAKHPAVTHVLMHLNFVCVVRRAYVVYWNTLFAPRWHQASLNGCA